MGIRVERQSPAHADAMRAFNARLTARGAVPGFLPAELPPPARQNGAPIVNEAFVALEDGHVRGSFELHAQMFAVGEEYHRLSHYRAPISEGIADRRYAFLGMLMAREALRTNPFLFCVGMGGVNQPLPRLLAALKFTLCTVPLLFRLARPARVLRELPLVRAARGRAVVADLLAYSGLGSLGARLHTRAADALSRRWPALTAERVKSWGDWADELWRVGRGECSLAAVRDAAALEAMYPPADPWNICLRLSRGREVVGWAVLYDTAMQHSAYFGNLRVGTVLDCWTRPGYAVSVARAATHALEARGVDLVITNQAHAGWISAFRRIGYVRGPSNYALALSPALATAVRAHDAAQTRVHMTRGDGDGRIHLGGPPQAAPD